MHPFRRGLLALAPLLLPLGLLAQTPATTQNTRDPAPTEIANRQLPGWLRLDGEYRARFEYTGGIGFSSGEDDAYLLNRIRLSLSFLPSTWLKIRAQTQDARIFWNQVASKTPPNQDPLDLRLAYVEVGDFEKHSFALRAGRQEFIFGRERLLGASNWTNTARSFDGVRLTVGNKVLRLDAFASAVVNQNPDAFDHHVAGDDLHGLYVSSERLIPKSVLDGYVFWHVAPRVAGENGRSGKLDSKTIGVRGKGALPADSDYTYELVGQTGSWAGDTIAAWAAHGRLAHAFVNRPWSPRAMVEYDYASGDKNAHDRQHGTFDVLYPTAHDKYGMADQVGWKNIHHLGPTMEFTPSRKLQFQARYHAWWLASTRDGLYSAPGKLLVKPVANPSGRFVGQEADIEGLYTLQKRLQFGSGLGHIFPGAFLKEASPGGSYTLFYLLTSYAF